MAAYDTEIDLQPYILSLFRNLWKIALLVLVAAVLAIVVSLIQPNRYEATATILITRSRPSLALAQQFPTLVEPVDSASRMNALLSISNSDSLAVTSFEEVKDDLPVEMKSVEEFKDQVSITSSGDVILITASAHDPDLAARIANAWAEQAVLSINAAYSGEQLPSRIQAQLVEALNEYETAQTELELFLETSQAIILKRQLEESEALLNNLTNTRAWQIAYYTQRQQNMDQIMAQAEALRQQLGSGSVSKAAGIGDAIAVLQVRANVFGVSLSPVNGSPNLSEESSVNSPVINFSTEGGSKGGFLLDIPIEEIGSLPEAQEDYQQDLEILISLARDEKSKAEEILQELSLGVLQEQPDDLVQQAANQVQELTAKLENEEARLRELTSHRDLVWRAYQALAEKETELRSATQTSDQVSLATQAVPPQEPSPGGLVWNTVIAIVVSFLLGSLIVIGSYWWRNSILSSGLEHSSPAADLK